MTCTSFSDITLKIDSFDRKLTLAINILDTKNPIKFLSFFPNWKNEYLIIAIGCIGNVHGWTIKNTFREGIFEIVVATQKSFYIKNLNVLYLLNKLENEVDLRCCISNLEEFFNQTTKPYNKHRSSDYWNGSSWEQRIFTDEFFWDIFAFAEKDQFVNTYPNICRVIERQQEINSKELSKTWVARALQ
jgi:hypothetical protein